MVKSFVENELWWVIIKNISQISKMTNKLFPIIVTWYVRKKNILFMFALYDKHSFILFLHGTCAKYA
jgi:hypothetical protein